MSLENCFLVRPEQWLSKFNEYSKISILQILLTYVIRGLRLDQSIRITLKNDTGCFTMDSNFYACLTSLTSMPGLKNSA
jgi:hypothetical protein